MRWDLPAKSSRMKALILRAWRSITWWWGLQAWFQGGVMSSKPLGPMASLKRKSSRRCRGPDTTAAWQIWQSRMSRCPRARYPARDQMIYLTSTKAKKRYTATASNR